MGKVSLGCALCALCALYGCVTENSDGNAAPVLAAGSPALPVGGAGAMALAPATAGSTAGAIAPVGGSAGTQVEPVAGVSGAAGGGGEAGSTDPVPPDGGAGPELAWEALISADWELPAGEETTYCQRVTLTEDVYFKAIRALNPLGTHHTATTVASPPVSTADELTRGCGSQLSPQGIFGSGVGTDMVIYPPGVGMRLRAGQQVLLNLHVYNTGTAPMTGTSGTEIVLTNPDEIEHVAESVLAGPALFSIPAGGEEVVAGGCTINSANTLFAVQPHMHQLGVHMKGVARTAAHGEVVLHDGPFDFENQVVVEIEPLEMEPGDTIDIECTFNNTTDRAVGFGESSDTEMCFLVLHRYPAPENPSVICAF